MNDKTRKEEFQLLAEVGFWLSSDGCIGMLVNPEPGSVRRYRSGVRSVSMRVLCNSKVSKDCFFYLPFLSLIPEGRICPKCFKRLEDEARE